MKSNTTISLFILLLASFTNPASCKFLWWPFAKVNNIQKVECIPDTIGSTKTLDDICGRLGPSIPDDNEQTSTKGLSLPPNLEHVVEFQIPIGFRRLRKAMLSENSEFWLMDILQNSLGYKK